MLYCAVWAGRSPASSQTSNEDSKKLGTLQQARLVGDVSFLKKKKKKNTCIFETRFLRHFGLLIALKLVNPFILYPRITNRS